MPTTSPPDPAISLDDHRYILKGQGMTVTSRVVSESVRRFTIWDNFERHVEELKAIGATDADIAPLKTAAEAVAVIEQQDSIEAGKNPHLDGRDIGALTAPHTCSNGWLIAPPSPLARRYAVVAALKLTNGIDPVDRLAIMAVVTLTLWVLKMWGDGKKEVVMQAVYSSGVLPELMPGLMDECDPSKLDGLMADYQALMGTATAQKKTSAMETYNALFLRIHERLLATSTVKF